MGAWGYSVFDDDSALDFYDTLVENEDGDAFIDQIEEVLNNACESDYLEVDEGNAVLVSSCIIDACINNTEYKFPSDEYSQLISENHKAKLRSLRTTAVDAINAVLSENSELNELWYETETYEDWKNSIQKIKENLM
ncbi:MAG: DUF4259 domain-containing protein [Oscillospiraceae bacterium]|nr:DUF4259 domain-containing protein [Oscillospiraceae bacterium]